MSAIEIALVRMSAYRKRKTRGNARQKPAIYTDLTGF